jgi:hypothetical protein
MEKMGRLGRYVLAAIPGARHTAGLVPPRSRRPLRGACLAVLLLSLAFVTVSAHTASAHWSKVSLTLSKTEPHFGCPPRQGRYSCQLIVDPAPKKNSVNGPVPAGANGAASPALEGGGVGGGFSPANLRSAYNLPSTSGGSGQTVAIVDAYNDPNAESDLEEYRKHYSISACTNANGCFRKVNQAGGTSYPENAHLPPTKKEVEEGKEPEEWAGEISLDLDMVSATCPNCHIILVEANSSAPSDFDAAENEAAALGATEISNSWSGEEIANETAEDPYFTHPGVPITVASGDDGYQINYPATSPDVIAVGGTTLTKASGSRGWAESVWYNYSEKKWVGTGSGCSLHEPKPVWQKDSGCAQRTTNDVAAVADENTPVSIYDSYDDPEEPWRLTGGTSVATPVIASAMALANAYTRSFPGAEALYVEALQNGTGVLDDVLSGSNGTCTPPAEDEYFCTARSGYDGPTGLGSLWGAPSVAQTLPSATTEAATGISTAGAVLHGSVDPNGPETHYYFQYGETTAYGSSTPEGDAGFGMSGEAEHATITGLKAVTTYHYRIVATSWAGTSYGSDQTFTTRPYVAMIENGVGYLQEAPFTASGWKAIASHTTQMMLSGNRVAMIENGVGYFQEAPFTASGWKAIASHTTQMVLSGNRVAMIENGVGYFQEAPFSASGWKAIAGSPSQMVLSGNRVAMIENGVGYFQEAPFTASGWKAIASHTTQMVLSGNRVAMIESGAGYFQEAPFSASGWKGIASHTTQMVLSGNRVAMIENGVGYFQEAPFSSSGWKAIAGTTSQMVMTGEVVAMVEHRVGYFQEAPFSASGWKAIAGTTGQMVLSGSDQALAPFPESSPAVIRSESGSSAGDQWLFYQAANGQMSNWYDMNSEPGIWHNVQFTGEAVAAGTSPVVARIPTYMWAYYQGVNGQIWVWYANETGWHNEQLTGEAVAAGASPTVVRSETEMWVYYQGVNGQMWMWRDNTAGWHNEELAGETFAAGMSPTVVRSASGASSGDIWVYYQGVNGQMWAWSYNTTGWHNEQRSGELFAPGASPAVDRAENESEMRVFYPGANSAIWNWYDNTGGWHNEAL